MRFLRCLWGSTFYRVGVLFTINNKWLERWIDIPPSCHWLPQWDAFGAGSWTDPVNTMNTAFPSQFTGKTHRFCIWVIVQRGLHRGDFWQSDHRRRLLFSPKLRHIGHQSEQKRISNIELTFETLKLNFLSFLTFQRGRAKNFNRP